MALKYGAIKLHSCFHARTHPLPTTPCLPLTQSITGKTSGPPRSYVLPALLPSSLMAAVTADATSATCTGWMLASRRSRGEGVGRRAEEFTLFKCIVGDVQRGLEIFCEDILRCHRMSRSKYSRESRNVLRVTFKDALGCLAANTLGSPEMF